MRFGGGLSLGSVPVQRSRYTYAVRRAKQETPDGHDCGSHCLLREPYNEHKSFAYVCQRTDAAAAEGNSEHREALPECVASIRCTHRPEVG